MKGGGGGQIDPLPQEKLPSKSPALLGLRSIFVGHIHFIYCGWFITQMHGRAFQTLGRAFQTLSQAFSFLLSSQKFGQVFQKLSWALQRLGHMFWNKCSTESFDQRTYWEFLIIWSVKNSLHTSNNSPKLVTKIQISAFNFEIFYSV